MRGHKVVTLERQGGYAARCDTCGVITFGGFRTRTEARAELAHEHKKAPGTLPRTGGQTPTRGINS